MPDQSDFHGFMNLREFTHDPEPLPGPFESLCRSWANVNWDLVLPFVLSAVAGLAVLYIVGMAMLEAWK